jgi:hypothetical protein
MFHAFPAQSVRLITWIESGCWALICSNTFWASMVDDVALLFLLSVSLAKMNKMLSAPKPTARMTIANMSSTSVMPDWFRFFPLRNADSVRTLVLVSLIGATTVWNLPRRARLSLDRRGSR